MVVTMVMVPRVLLFRRRHRRRRLSIPIMLNDNDIAIISQCGIVSHRMDDTIGKGIDGCTDPSIHG